MSAITCDCIGAYKEGIDNTCDAVDGSIKVGTVWANQTNNTVCE